jgi:AcrR family transcriptional regulator
VTEKKVSAKGQVKSVRRARGSLSQDEILEAAKALVEEEGLTHLNMPALAKRLNSGVTSIYWYFRSKDDLVTALTNKVAREMYRGLPPVGTKPWDEELVEYFAAFRDLLTITPIYREVFAYRSQSLYQEGSISSSILSRLEEGMAILVSAGLTPNEAEKLMTVCSSFTRGFVLLEHGIATERASEEADESRQMPSASMVAQANRELYPTLTQIDSLDDMFDLGDDAFRHGLGLMIDGAKHRLGARARA